MPMITKKHTRWMLVLCSTMLILFSSCSRKITESGKASYYADKFEGRKTASGSIFHQNKMTAAHRTLPFGTKVKVVNIANGRSVKVTITDRGPFAEGRVIDLSKKAAKKLGMISTGLAPVEIKYKKKK
ncbi:septal ring lytic transglycosylase RlpA family protein [Chitinophaga sancti]|uniref:septal ring lytic transglycosylase RlpA family protein n=1 Tax=Chitinophaga sancti TaxID=1004 RepID=UPI002A7668CD|nr:septal ring lytic transglycosylase RlpA family protein [Chitinophaga sancti]WPQ64225.1 septal ring lytic transglycosylase RlpA family protein [Chitinophaga sancti]